MTAVKGHLTSSDFEDAYRRWQSVDPMALFDAPIQTFIKDVRYETYPELNCLNGFATRTFTIDRRTYLSPAI